jgi:hypothetical protein
MKRDKNSSNAQPNNRNSFIVFLLFNYRGSMNMKRVVSLLLIVCLLAGGFLSLPLNGHPLMQERKEIRFTISPPRFSETDEYVTVNIEEAESLLMIPGKPVLPVITRKLVFPLGTQILGVSVEYTSKDYILTKDIHPCPSPKIVGSNQPLTILRDDTTYGSSDLYPPQPYIVTKGGGIQVNDQVLFLKVSIYPQYQPSEQCLHVPDYASITINYIPIETHSPETGEYDMVLIAPARFSSQLQPLITHKNDHGITTFLKTTEDIYNQYPGRDQPEQIKYFIEDALKTMGISYVLLIGSVNNVPMRTVDWNLGGTIGTIDMLTDLYYSDVYDGEGNFCSWDASNDGIFGDENDKLDYYPNVHIGRLACETSEEVRIVVDKIIHYETHTAGQDWFNRIILMGGDTFPEEFFDGATGSEGEAHNQIIMDIMSAFTPVTIWMSQGNFKRNIIAQEINTGAGFLMYSGHGTEHAICPESGHNIYYYRRYIRDLTNYDKLPIMFFTACNTAKLDFTLDDLLDYRPYRLLRVLTLLPQIDKNMLVPCFSWSFVNDAHGGSVATIGSTDYILSSSFDPIETPTGCIKPPIYFFQAYNTSETLGEMMTEALTQTIHDIPSDYLAAYTAEEHILLGDPSLKLGGYT